MTLFNSHYDTIKIAKDQSAPKPSKSALFAFPGVNGTIIGYTHFRRLHLYFIVPEPQYNT
jgi:hypothetical protein